MIPNSQQPVTLRATSSVAVFWVVVAACVIGLVDAAIRGSWSVFIHALPIIALVAWAAWFLLYRPSIRLEGDRMVVTNLGRVAEVPWNRITDIRRRYQIVAELDDGTKVECWGGPFPSRTGARKPASERVEGSGDPALDAVRIALRRSDASSEHPITPGVVVRRWDLVSLAIGAAIALFCVVATALPF